MAGRTHARTMEPTLYCEEGDCGLGPFTPRGLAAHKRLKHGEAPAASRARQSSGARPGRATATETVIRQEGDKLVVNLGLLAMGLSLILPTTGTTILRRLTDRELLDAGGRPVIVDDRPQTKRGIASVILDAGRRDDRIMSAIQKFNKLFDVNDAAELGLSVVAAVAVDVGVNPDVSLPLGPFGQLQPIRQLIGDVVADLEDQAAAAAAGDVREAEGAEASASYTGSPASANGQGVYVPGGVEET